MNHGFAVDRDSLPAMRVETHVSLFDGSNCGLALTDRPGLLGAVPPRSLARARATATTCSAASSR